MARWPTRGLRTGVASSRLVLVLWWWLRVPLNPAPVHCPGPVYLSHACTSRLRPRQSGWGAVLRCLILLGKEHARSRVRYRLKPRWAERWLWTSRGGFWRDVSTTLLLPAMLRLVWWARLQKRTIWLVLVSCHASRDWRVRWERSRRIKCPSSRAHVRRRVASLRSRLFDSYEPVPVFDGNRHSSPSRFARRSFCVRGYGRR